MQRACLLAALLAILLSVGCGKKGAGMSGTFKRKPSLPAGDVTMTFQEDGTFVVKRHRRGRQRNVQTRRQEVDHYDDRGEREAAARLDRKPMTATLSEDGKSFNPS